MDRNQKQLKTAAPDDLTAAAMRVQAYFLAYPRGSITLSDLCMATKTSKSTGRAVVEEFVKAGIIHKEVIGRLWRLSANQASPLFLRHKIVHNLAIVYETGIVDQISSLYRQARAIILFGSFRKGDDIEESDLDIAIEMPGLVGTQVVFLGNIPAFGYRKNVKVNLHLFCKDAVDLNVFANIANGIVLAGYLEVRP